MSMKTIMIVDDSNVIRNKIQRACGHNFEVVGTARNGEEAVVLFNELRPDAITMHLTMPKMDGLHCISELMAIDDEVNILVISALSDKATGIKAIELGARGFLYKPFGDEALIEALTEIFE